MPGCSNQWWAPRRIIFDWGKKKFWVLVCWTRRRENFPKSHKSISGNYLETKKLWIQPSIFHTKFILVQVWPILFTSQRNTKTEHSIRVSEDLRSCTERNVNLANTIEPMWSQWKDSLFFRSGIDRALWLRCSVYGLTHDFSFDLENFSPKNYNGSLNIAWTKKFPSSLRSLEIFIFGKKFFGTLNFDNVKAWYSNRKS